MPIHHIIAQDALTTERTDDGFAVLWNGQATGYSIINGSKGLSGRDTRNMYGIISPSGQVTWIGSLQSAKQLLARKFGSK